jgi:DNA-binding CsgD family transcriptional regulator
LSEALRELQLGRDTATVRSIAIPAVAERPPLILHLVPVRGSAHDVFGGAGSVVVVTPVQPRAVPNAEVLQGLFDLTPAEARVARAIAAATRIVDIAGDLRISQETVRTQLKAVLGKTGVGRQADLVALLSGLALSDRDGI